ncbi:MAG: helix-turn-helix domain-containing protein [Verrucomicrobia bacterium]|nr:MAG: helix-turn-helix domain-containing protein [Verrucomicrobiota bacterium]
MKLQSSQSRRQIALLVETSLGSGREILRGIAQFARDYANWEIFHAARGLEDSVPDWLKAWDGDGVIARIQNEGMLHSLKKLEPPIVDVLGVPVHDFPLVQVDDVEISKQVARHFFERDFVHFGFYGIKGENWSQRRQDALRQAIGSAGSFAHIHSLRGESEGDSNHNFELQQWLVALPKPVAIMVCSDQRGLALLEACRAVGLTVPEQVSVVGVDNDLAFCEVATPNLSSVRGGHMRVGFEAAKLLNHLIDGQSPPDTPVLVAPNEIVVRESSDSRSISDPAVRDAVRFIRERLSEAITNEDIAKAVGISKTRVQVRFRAALGMSIREFVAERRLLRAEKLIVATDLTFADIAERCGFRHHEYLGYVLKKRRGITPRQLRSRAESPSAE